MKNIIILTFIALISQTFAVVPIQNRLSLPNLKFLEDDAGCELKPQNAATLDNKMARIIDTKYGDGIIATQIYNAVRHGRCQNESPSICNWVFGHCGQSSIYNQTLNDVFSVQSEFYPGNYMYANVASAVSHYNVTGLDVCTMDNKYKWMIFYAECVDRWYLFNLSYLDFLDASDLGLVKHTRCNVDDPFRSDTGCPNWRNLYFYGLSDWNGNVDTNLQLEPRIYEE